MNTARTILELALATALSVATGCVATAGVPDPPPPRAEVHGCAPSALHAWTAGHWSWRGGWVWVGGSWALRPYAGAVWVPGHWVRGHHGATWVEGHWR